MPGELSITTGVPVSSAGDRRLSASSLIAAAGLAAQFATDEFFHGTIRNRHTRAAYELAVRRFLMWLEPRGIPLPQVTPGMIGDYFDQHPGSIPTRKLHLAALRAWFDGLVNRHVCILNPAASVRGERYSVVEGKTAEISPVQARTLLESIDTTRAVGRRDKAIIATMVYTAARAGAVAGLRLADFVWEGTQHTLRFREKGGKLRTIPCRHDLERLLLDYLDTFDWQSQPTTAPLFRSVAGRTGQLTEHPLRNVDLARMLKRRLAAAGLPPLYTCHSFRVCTITDLLTQGIALEDVAYLAGHADVRTTQLYDRRQRRVTRNLVERISI